MKLKSTLTTFLIILFLGAFGQDYSGTWVGVFHTDMGSIRRTFHFFFELQQSGRAVWGIGSNVGLTRGCTYKLRGQLDKKVKNHIELYSQGLTLDKLDGTICGFVFYFELSYSTKGPQKYITGNWFGDHGSPFRADGAAGSVVLFKISDSLTENVDQYFNDLDKFIRKSNPGDTHLTDGKKNPIAPIAIVADTNTATSKTRFLKRQDVLFETINVDSDLVDVELFDNGIIDGDSVSLYLNRQVVLKNYMLNEVSKKVQLRLEPNIDNEILIVAENLGSIPPNTGLMVINANGVRYEIHVSTSFQNNGKVLLKWKPKKVG
jgi:hypothetical protein